MNTNDTSAPVKYWVGTNVPPYGEGDLLVMCYQRHVRWCLFASRETYAPWDGNWTCYATREEAEAALPLAPPARPSEALDVRTLQRQQDMYKTAYEAWLQDRLYKLELLAQTDSPPHAPWPPQPFESFFL